jgi:hypothetical protein
MRTLRVAGMRGSIAVLVSAFGLLAAAPAASADYAGCKSALDKAIAANDAGERAKVRSLVNTAGTQCAAQPTGVNYQVGTARIELETGYSASNRAAIKGALQRAREGLRKEPAIFKLSDLPIVGGDLRGFPGISCGNGIPGLC